MGKFSWKRRVARMLWTESERSRSVELFVGVADGVRRENWDGNVKHLKAHRTGKEKKAMTEEQRNNQCY